MKKILIMIFLLPFVMISQSKDKNYIKSIVYQKGYIVDSLSVATNNEKIEIVSYFDDFGRTNQTINLRAGGEGQDLITHIEYDKFGRQIKDYLPYATAANGGLYRTDALTSTNTFYNSSKYENTENPFSQKTLEASPLNKILNDASPGNPWMKIEGCDCYDDLQSESYNTSTCVNYRNTVNNNSSGHGSCYYTSYYGYSSSECLSFRNANPLPPINNSGHTIAYEYKNNNSVDYSARKFTCSLNLNNGVYNPSLHFTGNYNSNVLMVKIIKDENWIYNQTYPKDHTTQEYKNKEGQIVLKRAYDLGVQHDTYYVYDLYGNLTYVIPPKASGLLNITSIQSDIISPNIANAETTVIVNSGTSLQLTASNSIRLLPGFNAMSGSTFSAKIDNGMQNNLDDLCYQYKYDSRNRLAEKKLPGKDWEYIVYDKLDRPVLTQDANLRTQNKWLFTKYDAFGRVVYTGDYKNTAQTSRTALQALVDTKTTFWETKQVTSSTINGTTVYYTNDSFPNNNDVNINLFTINYYDDYNFDLNGGIPSVSYDETPITNVKSLATGTKIRVLETSSWITNVSYYDAKARPIYSYSKNDYLATISTVKTKLDFIGQILETTSTHLKNSITTSIVDVFTYNHAGRLTKQTQAINGTVTPEVIAVNTYDELGQLIKKEVGGKATATNRLQTIDYTYNIRGWLKGINDVNAIGSDLFAFKINYNDIADASKKLYNGNISQTLWKTKNNDTSLKNYTYSYDALNRLTLAESQDSGRYNESLGYDKNGNIMNLTRKGYTDSNATVLGTMDNLVYTYNNTNTGNKLMKVTDGSGSTEGFKDGNTAGDDYSYDDNGNMTKDLNKGITTAISYNHLNLPTQITFATGNIQYVYDATGVKLQKKVVENGKSDIYTKYAGSFIYEKIGTATEELKFFSQPEGYVAYNSGTYDYIYQYKDHLGNIRLSYDKNLTIVEENNYYPFGLKQKGYNNTPNYAYGNAQAQKYKYNGKELQDELGLNLYDYGWRNYDPAIGRWINPDPLLNDLKFTFDDSKVDEDDKDEVFEAIITKLDTGGGIYNPDNLNPYGYGYDNPISFNDPDGRCPICPFIALAIYLLAPEPVMAPTRDHAGDGKKMAEAKGLKNALLLSTIPIVRDASTLNKLSNASKTKNTVEKAVEKEKSQSNDKSDRTLKDPLRRDKNGEPKADPEAEGTSHTQLGTKQGRKGDYKQGREFDKDGNPVKDIDHTDHGRPSAHPDNPHQHRYLPNPSGGTPQRSKLPEPISHN